MYVLRNNLFKVLQKETACAATTCIIALLGLSNHMDRNVQCLLLTAMLGKVLATFEQKYACKFPCAYTHTKKPPKNINQKPLHYLSSVLLQPYDPVNSCEKFQLQ